MVAFLRLASTAMLSLLAEMLSCLIGLLGLITMVIYPYRRDSDLLREVDFLLRGETEICGIVCTSSGLSMLSSFWALFSLF